MAKSKAGRKKSEKSIIQIQGSKEYNDILAKASGSIDLMTGTLAKIKNVSKEEAMNEISSIFVQKFKKADDLTALATENIATLLVKKQLSDQMRAVKMEETGEIDETALEITKQDVQLFKLINDGIKTLGSLKPKEINHNMQTSDDKMVFEVTEGIYTEE